MDQASTQSYRSTAWGIILFLIATSCGALIGVPCYLAHRLPSPAIVTLTVFYSVATALCITAGYHRLFAHASYKAAGAVRFLILFFGAAAFEQSALNWASQHRDHHRFTDTDADPYNIKKGFLYAHIGWITLWKRRSSFENVKDLRKSALLMHQHRFYGLWASGAGILLPLVIGALFSDFWGALLFAVALRTTFVYHSTFLINSVCHLFGNSTYDPDSTAKDSWFIALLTYGEGYHNFHHRFPSDYRNGVRWYHWDPSKWLISLFEFSGQAWGVKRISKFRIMEARISADKLRVERNLDKLSMHARLAQARTELQHHYDRLRQSLSEWESQAKAYRDVLSLQLSKHSEAFRWDALKRKLDAQEKFERARTSWEELKANILQPPLPV